MVISLPESKTLSKIVSYLVKYSIKGDVLTFNEYYMEDNLLSQVKDEFDIQSTWGNFKEKGTSIEFVYYYMIYPTRFNYTPSICTPPETLDYEMTNKTELLWMNSNKSYFEYTTAVLVFFEDKEGEHFYAYQTQSIAGKKF